jgi:hypothetical protein
MSFELKYAHGLQAADARARLVALGEYLSNKHGLGVTWLNDDEAKVTGKYLVVSIEGMLRLSGDNAEFTGKDPGMLWRGKAREYLLGKLKKYLDPATPVTALPRG